MKSLKDYFFEDENKFVNIEYKTTTDDDVQLAGSVHAPADELQDNVDPEDILPGGADLKLVGELRLYSETSQVFYDRKRKIAEVFKTKLKDEEITANRVKFTKIFDYYIKHLIYDYKKHIDENAKINVSSKQELERQLSSDIVMLIRNQEILPNE